MKYTLKLWPSSDTKSKKFTAWITQTISEILIEERIKNNQDVFDRGHNLKKIDIDDSFPDYIVNNVNYLKDWII